MSVKKYCYCENNCKYETLDKEEILAAIAQAIETGKIGECDTGFITTLKTINGRPLNFFVGLESEYADLTEEQKINLFAIITNDTTKENLLKALEDLQTWKEETTEFLATSKMQLNPPEMEYDEATGGFKINGAGVYLVILRNGTYAADSSNTTFYTSDIITIPNPNCQAYGTKLHNDINQYSGYKTYYTYTTTINDYASYRIKKSETLNYKCYKAFKLMSL